jgi:hypothetical protein
MINLTTLQKIKIISRMSIINILVYVVLKFQEIINISMIGHQTNISHEDLTAMIAGVGLGNTT